jgi:hypothetical protein
MKRLSALIIGLSVLVAGCSDKPTGPSQITTSTFTVPLTAANEVPPTVNADAGATGTVTITLNVTRDGSDTITSATADFQISVAGFPPGTTVTDAHIHNAPAGVIGGVYVNVGLSAGELVVTNGSGSVTKNGINVPADKAAAILSNPAGHYFNVHTGLNPNGAIRGQLSAPVTY